MKNPKTPVTQGDMERLQSTLLDRFDAHAKQLDNRFRSIDKRFDSVDKRFEAMDKRFDNIEDDLNKIKLAVLDNLATATYIRNLVRELKANNIKLDERKIFVT
jgi:enoyl reductase-like protein